MPYASEATEYRTCALVRHVGVLTAVVGSQLHRARYWAEGQDRTCREGGGLCHFFLGPFDDVERCGHRRVHTVPLLSSGNGDAVSDGFGCVNVALQLPLVSVDWACLVRGCVSWVSQIGAWSVAAEAGYALLTRHLMLCLYRDTSQGVGQLLRHRNEDENPGNAKHLLGLFSEESLMSALCLDTTTGENVRRSTCERATIFRGDEDQGNSHHWCIRALRGRFGGGTMDVFESTVQQVLQKGHIGTPVSVRWILAEPESGGVQTLARMLAAAECWLGSRPIRIHARGGGSEGSTTVSAVFERGQTAILIHSKQGDRSDLMVLGNQGAVYHEDQIFLPQLSALLMDTRLSELASLVEVAVNSSDAIQTEEGGDGS